MTKSEIKKLLAKGQLETVLEILLYVTEQDENLNKEISLTSYSYHDLNRKERNNLIDFDKISQAKAKIADALADNINMAWKDDTEDKPVPNILLPPFESNLSPQTPKQYNPKSSAKTLDSKQYKPYIALLALGIVVVFAGLWWFLIRPISSHTDLPALKVQSIMVSLYGEAGLQDKPLKSGTLRMEALESIFKQQVSIDSNGNAIFDSVPLELIGKKVFFSLEVDKKFQLAEPQNEYLLAERVNVKLKEKKKIVTPPTPIGESFKGDWKNINDASNGISFLEISRANPSAPLNLRVRSKCCVLTIAYPRNTNNNRITLNDFDFGTNHYSNFVIEKLSINSLVCTCLARLGDGREYQIRDTLRKQLKIQSGQ